MASNPQTSKIMFNTHHFRHLTKALLLMDLRGQHYARATGAKPGEAIPPLFWVIGQFLFVSGVLSVALFGRVDSWGFAFANLSAAILLTISAVIVEFNEVVLNTDDLYILGHRPVSRKTYAAARLANLGAFIFLIFIAMSIFPAIIGCNLRDASGWWLPVFLLSNFAAVFGTAAAVVILYTFSPPKQGENDWRDMLAWLQIVLALVFFYGAQFMFRDGKHQVEMFLNYPPAWAKWLPSAWLASFVSENVPRLHADFLFKTLIIIGIVVAAVAILLFRLINFYKNLRPQLAAPVSPQARSKTALAQSFWIKTGISKWLADSRPEQAVIDLSFTMLRRDRDLLMRSLPSLGTVLALLLLGLGTNQFGNPFLIPPEAGRANEILPIAVTQLLAISVPVVLHNFMYSRSHEVVWILQIAPRKDQWLFGHAARKAMLFAIFLPFVFCLFLLCTWLWKNVGHSAIHWSLAWLEILIFSHFAVRGIPVKMPFSRPAERGSIGGGIAPFLAAVSLAAMVLGGLQFLALKNGAVGVAVFGFSLLIFYFFQLGKMGHR